MNESTLNHVRRVFMEEFVGQYSYLFLELPYYRTDIDLEFPHASVPRGWRFRVKEILPNGAILSFRDGGSKLIDLYLPGEVTEESSTWFPDRISYVQA